MLSTVSRQVRSESGFARNVAHMVGGQVGRLGLQAVYFVLAARALGASDFGLLMAVAALVALLAPVASMGAVTLLIRHLVRDPARAATAWSTCITSVVALGLLVTLFVTTVLIAVPVFIPPVLFVSVALAELVGARLTEAGGAVHQARGRMHVTARLVLGLQLARLAALVLLLSAAPAVTVHLVAVVYAATSVMFGVAVTALTSWQVGPARPDLHQWRADLRDGSLFAVGSASQTIYNDVDKVMLGAMVGPAAVGLYSAGYRFVDLAFAPVRAMLGAAQPWFFREGAAGAAPVRRLAQTLSVPALAYGLLAAGALVALAPLAPVVLGPSFGEATLAVRLLAVLVLLKTVHYLAADALAGAGLHGARSLAQVLVAVLNVLLNLALIPMLEWRGAVLASVVCDLILGVVLWTVLLRSSRAVTSPR